MTVKRQSVPIRMRFLGQTEASKRVEIRARVAGYLHAWTFKEGDRVEQGQALFQIDSRPFEVALAEARARLGSAEATLGLARYHVRRLENLFSKQAASDVELEEWQVQKRVALAQVELAKAQVAAAELELGYATIEAPISGMIGRVPKDAGGYVDSGANGLLVVVQQVDPIYVRYSVTEQEIPLFGGRSPPARSRCPRSRRSSWSSRLRMARSIHIAATSTSWTRNLTRRPGRPWFADKCPTRTTSSVRSSRSCCRR